MRRLRERILMYGLALALTAALGIGATYYAQTSQESLEAVRANSEAENDLDHAGGRAVQIVRVFEQPLVDTLKLPGAVKAHRDVKLAMRRGGIVAWIGPREGDEVREGGNLLELDQEDAKARMREAQATHDLAAGRHQRMTELYRERVVAKEEFDESATALQRAEAGLTVARAHVEHGILHAPFDGILDQRLIEVGEHVAEGQAVMRVVDISRVEVMLDAPEKDAAFFQRGDRAEVVLTSGDARAFDGVVDFVALTADPASRTYPVKILVENSDRLLRPGMIVQAELARRRLERAIAVPFFTITDREEGKAVFVVENGVARQRLVQYGVVQRGLVEIVSGLNVGDVLVVVGQRDLAHGERVVVDTDLTDLAQRLLREGADLSSLAMQAGLLP